MKKSTKKPLIFAPFRRCCNAFLLLVVIFCVFPAVLSHFYVLGEEPGGTEKENRSQEIVFEEKVIVVARLPVAEESLATTPANITIITAEKIKDSGADNLQELLSKSAGIILFDDVGNDVEATVDMRGFNEGTAMAVMLDGVRINEPDDNRVNLEQIPLSSIERIEIYRGSSSSTSGAGALSGTINIITNDIPIDNFIETEASYGTYKSRMGRISAGLNLKNSGMIFNANNIASDGFRENSDYSISNIFIKLGGSYKRPGNLSFSFLHNKSSLGAPGSLTLEEIALDPYASPFNRVDGSDEKLDLLTLGLRKSLNKSKHFAASIFYRENDIYTLTTGRWLMGFDTRSHIESMGLISQYSLVIPIGKRELNVASGVETQISDFSSQGHFTDAHGNRYSSNPDSWNSTDLLRTGIFVQSTLSISKNVSFLAGARYDRDDLDYSDLLQHDIKGTARFSEMSFKGGVTINPSEKSSYYLLYSEAFLPPTVYDLFAFPFFGSNPDLKPSESLDYECGMRKRLGDLLSFSLSIFRIQVKDEVIFVLTDPINFTGRNENVGKSWRNGLEFSSEFFFSRQITAFLNYTYIDAEIRSSIDKGKNIPLVPENKISAGMSFKGGKNQDYRMSLSGIYVGKQYLTGDDSNSMKPLDSYALFDARISRKFKKFALFIEGKNLLDEHYETRGITNGFELFFTPAPGRTLSAGIEIKMPL